MPGNPPAPPPCAGVVARLLRDREMCEKLRGSDTADALYALLTETATSHAA